MSEKHCPRRNPMRCLMMIIIFFLFKSIKKSSHQATTGLIRNFCESRPWISQAVERTTQGTRKSLVPEGRAQLSNTHVQVPVCISLRCGGAQRFRSLKSALTASDSVVPLNPRPVFSAFSRNLVMSFRAQIRRNSPPRPQTGQEQPGNAMSDLGYTFMLSSGFRTTTEPRGATL